MNKLLYISAIVGNFLLLVYAVVLIVGIGGGWLDRELWLHSGVAKVAQLLLMASAMGLLFANIRISREQYGGRHLSLILCGNFFVNPFLSLCFLNGKADGKQTSTAFSKHNVYIPSQRAYILADIYIRCDILYAAD